MAALKAVEVPYTDAPQTTKEAIIIINGRLGEIEKDVGEILSNITSYMDKNNERVSCLELSRAEYNGKMDTRVTNTEKHIEKIDTRANLWGGGNTFLAIMAWVLALFK